MYQLLGVDLLTGSLVVRLCRMNESDRCEVVSNLEIARSPIVNSTVARMEHADWLRFLCHREITLPSKVILRRLSFLVK